MAKAKPAALVDVTPAVETPTPKPAPAVETPTPKPAPAVETPVKEAPAPDVEATAFQPAEKKRADTPHFEESGGEAGATDQPTTQPMIDAALNQSPNSIPQHPPADDLVLHTYEVSTQKQSLGRVKNVTDESDAIAEMCRVRGLVPSKHTFVATKVN